MPWLHRQLPYDPRSNRLPGMAPCDMAEWLSCDEAFAAQMALRDDLVATQPGAVIAEWDDPAPTELLHTVLAHLKTMPGYAISGDTLCRPDGVQVPINWAHPMTSLARMCQEDFCLLHPSPDGHCLRAAALCFPALWTLAEKLNRPLTAIHQPVAAYDATLARRVQRLFDAIRPGQVLWRFNTLSYVDPTLHQPKREGAADPNRSGARFLRSERQCLIRLPKSGAVVFSIHTYLLHRDDVPSDWWDGVEDP